jgi:hypothetical protein
VLSDDIMKIDPPGILDTHVEMTIIGGEAVYTSPAFSSVMKDSALIARP